ncbi:MAG: FliI/YscN family ATPase [Bryobacteraceae bacterium]
MPGFFTRYLDALPRIETTPQLGRVLEMAGLLVESSGPVAAIGDICEIRNAEGHRMRTQVVGFRNARVLSMPLDETGGLKLGDTIVARSSGGLLPVGPGLMGRVLDGFGKPCDGAGPIEPRASYNLYASPPGPLVREHITKPLVTGTRAIDCLLPVGQGQRIGIFGGSGVGKSTLLGSMARNNSADVTVIALVGERNREVKAFLEYEMGEAGMRRSVVVVSTSDRPAPLRVRACFTALAIAEYFRDQGAQVLLVMDSVTRLAMAQREIGLASGEPPAQKGYTPSVFALLPKIFERAGNFGTGSITGFFTVLVDGDDFSEPICDAVRAILDGHIVLSRQLAAANHYPAIEILQSVSRLQSQLSSASQAEDARLIREALAVYRQAEDLIQLGAYAAGSNPKLDKAIAAWPQIVEFLRQAPGIRLSRDESLQQLGRLATLLR